MNYSEFQTEFLTRYDAATSLAAPGWSEPEICEFLNIAQLRVVEERYLARDYNPISNIIQSFQDVAVPHTLLSAGSYTIELPEDYLYYIRSRTQLTRTNPVITDAWIPNDSIGSKTDINIFLSTEFNKPWFKYPKAFTEFDDSKSVLVVLTDYYVTAVSNIEITCIVEPEMFNPTGTISTNLDLSVHKQIVEYAVEEALKSIKVAKISNQ